MPEGKAGFLSEAGRGQSGDLTGEPGLWADPEKALFLFCF